MPPKKLNKWSDLRDFIAYVMTPRVSMKAGKLGPLRNFMAPIMSSHVPMTDIAAEDLLKITFDRADKVALEKIAHEQGYDGVEQYLRSLIANDTEEEE